MFWSAKIIYIIFREQSVDSGPSQQLRRSQSTRFDTAEAARRVVQLQRLIRSAEGISVPVGTLWAENCLSLPEITTF